MSKIIDNPFPTKYPGIMVVITAKKKGNKWYLTGKLKNTSGKTLTGYQPCTRTAKTADDLIICKEIVFTLESKLQSKKQSTADKDADNTVPVSPAGEKIQMAFEKVKAMDPKKIHGAWSRSTAVTARKYFERNILEVLIQCAEESYTLETSSRIQRRIRDIFRASKSGDLEAENRTVFRHLQEAEKIYRCMDSQSEEPLPIFDFDFDTPNRNRKEQFKSFSQEDRLKIVDILEGMIANKPMVVKRMVAMFDAGLRTGEACAVQFENIREEVTPTGIRYGLYCVEGQEDPANKGKVTKLLKTANAYRTVLFSSWGYGMICRCNQLAPETPSDTLPVTSAALCKEFRGIMEEIGITPQNIQLCWQENGGPKIEPTASAVLLDAQISDYILRRDRASRWKNKCGMSSDDIDMLLGHSLNGKSYYMRRVRRDAFLLPEHLNTLAELNENYHYHADDQPQISLSDESQEEIPLPKAGVRIIRNNTDHPIRKRICFRTSEPGDYMTFQASPGVLAQVNVQSTPFNMQDSRSSSASGS